eukprot:TRINITY_DN2553_c0_g2_i1.p2 TRINITY_DN2553_c0_g2~~TRINITY_DN2553_c0_g2_i1.p2  ORF type:complete len:143 (-),score=0.88 TRINITY_DN2553_c0_g2_i1:425-853(-)
MSAVPPAVAGSQLFYRNFVTDLNVDPIIEAVKARKGTQVPANDFARLPAGGYNLVIIGHGDDSSPNIYATAASPTPVTTRDAIMSKIANRSAANASIGLKGCVCHDAAVLADGTTFANVHFEGKAFTAITVDEAAKWIAQLP